MFHTCFKCKKDMGNDNCGFLADWPRPKKSKKAEPECIHNWSYLPSVVLHDIYSILNQKDRINASSVCRNWRQNLYHPSFWQEAVFKIDTNHVAKNFYKNSVIAHIVQNVTIQFDSLSPQCVSGFVTLLQTLSSNSNLKSLLIEPTHCRIEHAPKIFEIFSDNSNAMLPRLVQACCRIPLQRFSIGGSEDLCQQIPQFLQLLGSVRPEKVTLLGLASVKEDPGNYLICDADPMLFAPFKSLKVLSIDYDILSDVFLDSLENANNLQRLIVHIHGVWTGHPATSEEAWMRFKLTHPDCQLRLSFIHAYDEVTRMQHDILRSNMPLSHIKVFFCEHINLEVLNLLSSWYSQTLRSIVWVDSQCDNSQSTSWHLVRRLGDPDANQPDPLVMAAWLCPNLEEIVLLGYKYFEEDLVAIARLRNDTLRNLEVANEDVIFSNEVYRGLTDSKDEISKIIGKPWAPLKATELHPVICNSVAGDSDEYLLPKVIADLY